jgi:membrane associated rhomboid family serine protease
MDKAEKRRFYESMVFPAILLGVLWIIKVIEVGFQISFSELGLLPQSFTGLRGILFSPLLHSDWKHLSANSVPLFLLASGLFYYYDRKATTIFILSWLITGLWVWIFAKDTGIHIGASGVVYALATFHFTGGLLRREPRMMAFSLLVVFLYGGLVWGVIPDFFPEKNISWESHLLGGLAGILLAFAYRKEGPQRKQYDWGEDNEEEMEFIEDENQADETIPEIENETKEDVLKQNQQRINYIYKDGTENK